MILQQVNHNTTVTHVCVCTLGVIGCYQSTCTCIGDDVTGMKWVWSVVLATTDSIYLIISLPILLLLLSGDVELNPGPTLDDRPELPLLLEWLDPLVDWQSFGLHLPGITRHDIEKIEQEKTKIDHQKIALFSKWLTVNPNGTWRDVIAALKRRRENDLVKNITDHLQAHSTVPSHTMEDTPVVISSELNPTGTTTGKQ